MTDRIPIEPKYEIDEHGVVFNRNSGIAIPADEPLILFRAQDVRLPYTLCRYLIVCQDRGQQLAVAKRLVQVLEWQVENPLRVKEPDTVIDENWESRL